MPKGSGGGGNGGRSGGGATNGDAGQPGEVVREANKANQAIMREWGPEGGYNPSGKDTLNIYDGQAHYKPLPGQFRDKQFQGMIKAGFTYRDGEFVASATNKKAQEKLAYYRPSRIISQRPNRKEQYVNEELRG